MAILLKTITAGPYVWQATYPIFRKSDTPEVRGAKRETRSDAQAFLDLKHCFQKIELWIMCNLQPGDYMLTLTYDGEHLPATRKQAMAQLKYFRGKIEKEYAAHGKSFRALWCLESKTSAGRYHFHFLCPRICRKDKDIFSRCWQYGSVKTSKIRVGQGKTFEALARYIAKEYPEKVGQHAWSCTRNSRKPETHTEYVADNYSIVIPPGCQVIKRRPSETPFGNYMTVSYKRAYTADLKS